MSATDQERSGTAVLDLDEHVYHQAMGPNPPPTGRGPLLHPERQDVYRHDEPRTDQVSYSPHLYPTEAKSPRTPLLIFAGIVIGCALIAGAIFFGLNGHDSSAPTVAPPNPGPIAASPAPVDAASSSTCRAWKSTKAALDQTVGLPRGWDWDTPGIDRMIASRNAVITKAMDLFEPQIAGDPADVAAAARSYVAGKRAEVQKFDDRTFTAADGVAGNAALAQLNELCGLSN